MSAPDHDELTRQALTGDQDAAYMLARGCDAAVSFCEFLRQVVPDGELSPALFDDLADGFDRARSERARALVETIEIEVPIQGGAA